VASYDAAWLRATWRALGVGTTRTATKTDKNALKLERRVERATADDDIDAILANIKLLDAKQEPKVYSDVPKPTPRCNCSFTATVAQKPAEIILFGGELVDAAGKSRVYGDLYRYDVDKNKWSLVQSPNAPPPRSAHQAVAAGGDERMCSPRHPPQCRPSFNELNVTQ